MLIAVAVAHNIEKDEVIVIDDRIDSNREEKFEDVFESNESEKTELSDFVEDVDVKREMTFGRVKVKKVPSGEDVLVEDCLCLLDQ